MAGFARFQREIVEATVEVRCDQVLNVLGFAPTKAYRNPSSSTQDGG